jgi:hypothetical protein
MKNRFLRTLTLLPAFLLAACSMGTTTEAPKVTPPNLPEKEKATVIGRAVDEGTQAPLANTIIRLAEVYGSGDDGAYVLDSYFSPGATTDANGYFIMENIPPIGYVVVVGDVFDVYKIVQTEEGKPKVWSTQAGEVLDVGTLAVSLKVESAATPVP